MKNKRKEQIARLWCQHCKAMQKANQTTVECWYNPLAEEGKDAFCASCLDAVDAIYQLFESKEGN